jgi:hypothetical protein
MQNYGATILSQYGSSPVLTTLIASFNAAIDPSAFVNEFYSDMWDVATASGYGLDVWGRIVGVNRIIPIPTLTGYFGFSASGNTNLGTEPFGFGPFYFGVPASQSYALSDSVFLLLIYAKALSNISASTIQVYNEILRELFPGRGNAYVTDTGNMQEQLTFEFALQPYEVSVLKYSGAIAAPTGVQFNIMQAPQPPIPGGYGGTFGFKEAGYSASGFNNGIFFAGFS